MGKKVFFKVALITVLAFFLVGQVFAGGGGQTQTQGAAPAQLPVLRIAVQPFLVGCLLFTSWKTAWMKRMVSKLNVLFSRAEF